MRYAYSHRDTFSIVWVYCLKPPPRSPLGLRLANRLLGAANSAGVARVDLNPGSLIELACRRSGLDDFGENPLSDGLRVLCESLQQEGDLTPVGRLLAREMLLGALGNQLQLQDWFKRHPDIAEQDITAPLVIIGMPRTGTTILHELLALDADNRIPLTWEVAAPFPPPERASYDSDPRIAQQVKQLRVPHYLMPGLENLHRMGAQLPQECVAVTANVFLSMQYNTVFNIPTYARWLATEADMAPAYRHHRRMHQLLQWRCPARRWIVKSPGHLWSLEALLTEYPDARLIQTHRDPLKILSSLGSMVPIMRSAYQKRVDCAAIAQEWSWMNAHALNASLRSRQQGAIREGQVIDIQFRDFMQSPAREVERIYEAFGLSFSADMQRRIEAYIDANPADKHGGHRHRFADTGLDEIAERDKVRAYQDYFGVVSESL